MKNFFTLLLSTVLLSALCSTATAQNKAEKNTKNPVFTIYDYDNSSIIRGMSDNGQWAVSSSRNEGVCETRLINLDTKEATVISTKSSTEYGSDVTNDGNIIVGAVEDSPAFYDVAKKQWQKFEVDGDYIYGEAYAVSADGHYAVGEINTEDIYLRVPALWDLTNSGKLVRSIYERGLPTKDMTQKDQNMMKFMAISADHHYILGCMSYSYLPSGDDAGGCFFFVYDTEAKSYKPIGFTETIRGRWTPHVENLVAILEATMSNNGLYVTGQAHMSKPIEGEYYADEYDVPFLYDVKNDKFTIYDETMVINSYGTAVTNDGTVFDASPVSSPVREWTVRSGRYWYSLNEILKQKYNTTFKAETKLTNTGTVNSVSDDGKRLCVFPDPYSSYVVDLANEIKTECDGLKLLGTYVSNPEANAVISHLKKATLTFDRAITAVGGSNSAEIQDADGNKVYASIGFTAEGKELSVRFRSGTLTEGEKYYLFVPEGTVALADDATQTNSDILIPFIGRKDEPVTLTKIYPEENTSFSHIDYSTSPVMLTFSDYIAIADDATAYLYRNSEEEPFCPLTLAYSGNQLALYPSTTQYLFEGSTYHVVVAEGAVTDVAGNNPTAEIRISYNGNYVREISSDDVILFSDNFDSGYGNFMQYCGDKNIPTSEMQGWDFTTGMAWGLVREDNASSDMKAVSHSMYSPAGESNDWLVIPQIYIPDMLCSLKFLSQSYLSSKSDVLKVVVWEDNNIYNTLNEDIINRMEAEGTVIYNKVQSPGERDDYMTGEFTENTVSLADFAGKNIYIAFVNQNKDQSAIFLDSVQVRHDMTFLVSLDNEERVVSNRSVTISGTIVGNSSKTFQNLTMTLVDGNGYAVDTYTASGINLRKGSKHKFAFGKQLPLTMGVENKFSVVVTLDDETNTIHSSIKNLAFQPTKRIVLEEYTGRACGNCPLGILGIEKLEARYGEQFIPISIHTYNNDPISSGMSSYTSALGIDALGAPSGIINRTEGCYPTTSASVNGVQRFFFTNTDPELTEETSKLWMDYAAEEMEKPAECDINVTDMGYDPATMTFKADCEIKYALNAQNQTVNLFTVLLEDNISQAQVNYMSAVSSPDLGEWGLGGKYGQATVQNYLNQDVCRNVNGTTIYGTGGYIPSTINAGETYKATVSVSNPYKDAVLSECKVVVMMIDANTGKVVNAALGKYRDFTDGIYDIQLSGNDTHKADIRYNIAGQRVSANAKGLIILNGRKMFIK